MKKFTYTNENGESITFDNTIGSQYFIEKLVANVGKTSQKVTLIGQDGQKTTNVVLNPRTIYCDFIFQFVGSYEKYEEDWININSIFNPKLKGTIRYENHTGAYLIEASPLETPILDNQKFSMQFEADDPYWRLEQTTEYIFGTVKPLFKFPVSFANGPIKMGEWQKTFTYVNKIGINTPFKLSIEGVGDYAKITNDKGEYIHINKALVAGQKLTIDTATLEVKLIENGVETFANQYSTIDSTLEMVLHKGVNTLTYENGVSSLPITIININQLYVGVS